MRLSERPKYGLPSRRARTFITRDAKAVDHILRQPEGDQLRLVERQALVKEAIEVDMCRVPVRLVQQDVFSMAVTKPRHILLSKTILVDGRED